MESWATFFSLAVSAFWGYLFGRVAIMEGFRRKERGGFSYIMLCLCLIFMIVSWIIAAIGWEWESPVPLVIAERQYYNEYPTERRLMFRVSPNDLH